ncbi:hypothetical protein F5B19DRAFT_175528 [Rostrohypoxylon terebratum]|nr:hypothetical protein F5B19DRAFT_175528 [Rostrohypoxylon terebratum]
MMTSRQLTHINELIEELARQQTIPPSHLATLEQRLVIACKSQNRQLRGVEPRPRREIRSRYKQNKAQKVYLNVLAKNPHLFLPFLLVISPKACATIDTSSFLQNCNTTSICLLDITKDTLERIAQKNDITESPYFKNIIGRIFPSSQLSTLKPVTTAESERHWVYSAADLNAIRIYFGDMIRGAIETAPLRLEEKAKSSTLQTTECVRTKFPHQNFQDGVIWLDIGPAGQITDILFPTARSLLGISNVASLTFAGALMRDIALIFDPRICTAIETSQLRQWEKKYQAPDITKCVEMMMRCEAPYCCTLHLRIGFITGIHIANNLYAQIRTP